MSSSYASADGPQQQMDEEGRLLQQMLDICRAFISKKTGQVESVMQLRVLLQSHPSLAPSLLFDVLVALQPEFDEERARKEERADDIRAFLTQIGNELLPSDVLALEMNALGADEPATKSRIVKSKTRIYYKQLKFNLLREESEGYAKLITELFHPSTPDADLILTVDSLIGQFNLDPNRVIDIILECFEHSPHKRELFVRLIRDFKVDKEDLRSILALKFVFCQRADYTPMSLYRLASLLAQEGMIDVLELFTLVNPTQKEIMDECKSLTELIRVRSLRAETISSSGAGLLATSNEAFPISSLLGANDAGGPEPSAAAPAVSFSAAIQCQTNEDRKLAGNRFDDSIIYKNQKLGLLCALLEHGCWDLAKPLLDRLPENYPFGVCRRIAMAVANVIHYKIEPFYRQKYPHYRDDVGIRMKESWERFTCKPELVNDWPMLFNDACQIAFQLGAYVGARHDVAIKLIRLLNIFYEDPDANELVDYDNLSSTIVDFCDCVLVPASTLLDSNFAYCDELWQIMCRHTYQMRYRIYHRWRTVHTERCWDLSLQRGKVLGMTRYIIKRLSKDTAKVMGRQLGKICHSYPTIPLDYLLSKVQDFQNFIGPVVESIRFLSSMEFDVLAYCLIENLAAPEKQDFKISDISYSPWLQSLASFAAAIFKRYALDFGGILQYIANQLKAAQTMDLIVLREIVTSISGVESSTDLTQDHLDALCGGDTLRGEASYLQMAKPNRRSINRLRDALLRDSLFEALSILIGQQKQFIVFRDYKNYPLKLTAQMLDQCQETFVQFFHFLRTNLKADQYAKRMPSALALLTEFHLPVEAAFCLTRPIYMNEIETVYNSAKQKRKEESAKEDEKGVVGSKVSKLDIAQKSELYREAFIEKVERLSDEVKAAFPDSFWNEMTLRLHTIFWLLSVNDLTVPVQAYERTIDKCKKELQEILPAGTFALAEITTRGGGQKRAAKDEERLTALEQKLEEEKRKQMDHNSRILNILSDEDVKKNMFAKSLQNRSIQMMRFLQSCVLPRVLCSEVNAVYCAEFVRTLHFTKTTDFQTIIFFDKIFNDITPIVAGLSERETVCFGRFCRLLLETILHWHSSRSVFQTECEGFPGCITKIRKKEMDEKATADAFNYEFYKTICYKWQIRLSKSFGLMLGQQNYVLIRNAITLMLKILPYFPVLTNLSVSIQKHVTSVRDKEKGNRYDLNLLASSYLVQLHKRNELWEKEKRETGKKRLYENHEFSDTKATKPTAGPRSSAAAPYSNGTTARKPLVTAPEKSSTAPSPTPTSGGTNKQGTTTDASPPKRSRPPIRSGTKN